MAAKPRRERFRPRPLRLNPAAAELFRPPPQPTFVQPAESANPAVSGVTLSTAAFKCALTSISPRANAAKRSLGTLRYADMVEIPFPSRYANRNRQAMANRKRFRLRK